MANNIADSKYKELLTKILNEGERRPDRTGTGVISLFGPSIEFDVSERIPLLTTKKVNFTSILHETLWIFVTGDTNTRYLVDHGVKIWNEWADQGGNLGPIYGRQARAFQGYREVFDRVDQSYHVELENVDQIEELIYNLKTNPYSRRHVVTLWNPSTVPIEKLSFEDNVAEGRSVLPVCHGGLIQFYADKSGRLSLIMHQRSADIFLGAPFNYINYTLLLYMVAQVVGLRPYKLQINYGDAHIYLNHLDAINEQLSRPVDKDSPTLKINSDVTNFDNFQFSDFTLEGYDPHPFIKAPISV